MGSSCSRMGSRISRPRTNRNTNRSTIPSPICGGGGSASRATHEMENHPAECLVKSADRCASDIHEIQDPGLESPLFTGTETVFTTPSTEVDSRSESTLAAVGDASFEGGLRNVETSNHEVFLSECKELMSPHQVSADYQHAGSGRDSSAASTSLFKEQESSAQVSTNDLANIGSVNGVENTIHSVVSKTCSEVLHPSSSNSQGLDNLCSDGAPVENHMSEVMAVSDSDTNSVHVSNAPVNLPSLENEPLQEAIPSELGILVSNRERGRVDGGVLHVDVVSISSNIFPNSNPDANNHEARRNSRRLFWDAFSRRSSRRLIDSPTIVFSTDDAEDIGSHERWLVGLSGDFFDDGNIADSGRLGSRIPNLTERRRHSISEVWERLRGGLDESSRRNAFCPSGLHPDGTCSCESFLMTEESTTRASISRIVMLAEALFEVLDEIHRQPVSLSLSMVSSPAPESVVDSFPLKSHKKVDAAEAGDDVKECYICLAEYEDGDKIRVLPCSHEYHMSCVDKWLKEIHGVCPLCRGDVRDGSSECSVSNSEIPSI
ncbi:uncharacterized protein LOC107427610 isoform X1 [Ziziphus jujuba]|uniref:Uncharacterized protein LOC107427610 isoform X1 n=2 Tax=Ziziphus jujuba TaxID=326968 RepID=A0A6P4B4V8_ZIZJJ|nr:uncharacterized protein LOC107427610 isoform X1 [Ziziphus jujuba]